MNSGYSCKKNAVDAESIEMGIDIHRCSPSFAFVRSAQEGRVDVSDYGFHLQTWPKKCDLGWVISSLRQQAKSRNQGQTFLANSKCITASEALSLVTRLKIRRLLSLMKGQAGRLLCCRLLVGSSLCQDLSRHCSDANSVRADTDATDDEVGPNWREKLSTATGTAGSRDGER